jgi:hypothetical protein
MDNQIILTALQSQLAAKKEERDAYETSTSEPAFKALSDEVLASLRENVSPLIPKITLSDSRIEIMKSSRQISGGYQSSYGYTSMTIYLESNWRCSAADTKEDYLKINWYGSSATREHENVLNDLQIFGAVAAKLAWIEYEFINNWRPRLIEINKHGDLMRADIYQIEYNIRTVEQKVIQDGISKYKQVGFSCQINKPLGIETDYDTEGNPPILKEHDAYLKLSTGRSKWDYIFPQSFKVLKTNKYKTTLDITFDNTKTKEFTVSAKSFDSFIAEVYRWQTGQSDSHNKGITEKFKERLERHKMYS